jgi:signal transduction histidine kinase
VPRTSIKVAVPAAKFLKCAVVFIGQLIAFLVIIFTLTLEKEQKSVADTLSNAEIVYQNFLMLTLVILGMGMLIMLISACIKVRKCLEQWDKSFETRSIWNTSVSEIIALQKSRRGWSPVSDIVHEMRTPLAVIRGYAQLAEQCGPEERETIRSMMRAINREISNMTWIMEALGGRGTMDTQPIGLYELAEECVEGYRVIADDKKWSVCCEQDATVECNRSAVTEILRTIVDNAVKYTAKDGSIALIVGRDKTSAFIRVVDDGIGIEQKDIGNIFRKYYRGNTAQDYCGSGFGLYLAYRVAQCCGIQIQVESEIGKGSCFTIRFPKKCLLCQ